MEDNHPEMTNDQPLRVIGIDSLDRPDVIDRLNKKVYELKPLAHAFNVKYTQADYRQLDRYICQANEYTPGRGTDIVKKPTTIGTFKDLLGNQFEMTIIPGSTGFIYYDLTPVGNDTADKIRDILKKMAPKPEDVIKFLPPIGPRWVPVPK